MSDFLQKELLECVRDRLPFLMNQHRIGLIIIDSVAAVFRITNNYIERAEHMRALCQSLLKLSEKHRCAVVCVNQVILYVCLVVCRFIYLFDGIKRHDVILLHFLGYHSYKQYKLKFN